MKTDVCRIPDHADELLTWFDHNKRDLPWRAPGTSPWAVMVSEFMLQQTPVNRVIGPWTAWMAKWPTPCDLAAAPLAEALRAWGRLGYPRRAKRLHDAATVICRDHDGQVPNDEETLLSLPGVGEYTAAAITGFAFNEPSLIVDTNIRRVHARHFRGDATAATNYSAAERTFARNLAEQLPQDHLPSWQLATMELGAIVCTARTPDCASCPLRHSCAWQAAGCPEDTAPAPKKTQQYYGTDRYVRGLILQHLRNHPDGATTKTLLATWDDNAQTRKAITSLTADGLITKTGTRYTLPQ